MKEHKENIVMVGSVGHGRSVSLESAIHSVIQNQKHEITMLKDLVENDNVFVITNPYAGIEKDAMAILSDASYSSVPYPTKKRNTNQTPKKKKRKK